MPQNAKVHSYAHNEKRKSKKAYSFRGMHVIEDPWDVVDSHESVQEFWSDYNDKKEELFKFRKGDQWTDSEKRLMRWKKKALVTFNKTIGPVRTIMGTFIQNRYDVKPAPFEPTDQDVTDILTQRYHWHHHNQKVRYKDAELLEEALVGGDSWQESYVNITPGQRPRIIVKNQNGFGIYPDPDSRDLIERSDCYFIDRASYNTLGDLIDWFPEMEEELRSELQHYEDEVTSGYETKEGHSRAHETKDIRNGRFRTIERFYKVRKSQYEAVNKNDYNEVMDIGIDDDGEKRKMLKKDFPNYKIYSKTREHLYLAIVVPAFNKGMDKFLYNGPYHCQPRDPQTEKIMFPLQQLWCENIDGDVNGFVEYLMGPGKIINSMMSNKLHASKHAVNTSLLVDPGAFKDTELSDLEKHHADGDRTFRTKPGQNLDAAISLLPQGRAAPDTNDTLEYSNMFHEEAGSAPPAARGLSEGNVPGVLNQQRIEQAFTQLVGFSEKYKLFLTNRAKLWHYYDREYFTTEETFRVIEKNEPENADFMTINQWTMDTLGNIYKANDIGAAVYDMVFEDSWQSPSVRDKVRQQIVQMQQSAAVQQDTVLNTFLTLYYLKLSDAPQDLKDFAHEHSQIVKQYEQQKQVREAQGQELEKAQALQQIAQTEAEQTAGAGMPAEVPGVPTGPEEEFTTEAASAQPQTMFT